MNDAPFDPLGHGPADPAPAPGRRAVRPRDAATLIIVRRDRGDPQVLMGRRHGGHVFMPDKWVFPGGRIDRSDFRAPAANDLRPEVAARLETAFQARRARALGLAAIRETFEEAGLLLARPAPSRPAAGPWREFLAEGALPDLAALDLVARAITPPPSPRRYDTCFFMAEADRLLSLERKPDCGELDEIVWVALSEAQSLDLPNVTRFVLKEVGQRLDDPHRSPPFLRSRRGQARLAYL